MSVPPNTFPHGYQVAYNVVSGGHAGQPPSDQSGTVIAVDPIRHGQNVNRKEMPFVTTLRTPSQSALEETPFPPEPGTIVAVSFNMGDPTSRAIVGIPNEINNSQSLPGNNPIMYHVEASQEEDTQKNVPVKYNEEKDRGALVRNIDKRETGTWKHSKSKGLPTHVALYPLAGQVLPALQQVDTAVKSFASILGPNAIGQIPGAAMNLASLFNKMNKSQKKRLLDNKPRAVVNAIESMLTLTVEGEGSGTYITSGKVHEETFIENATELLSQCTGIGDIVECMQRLRYDESLHGLDKLQDVEIKANTAFGQMVMTMDRNGKVKQNEQSLQQILSAVQKFVGFLGSVPGGGQGKPMFGKEAAKVMASVDRASPGGMAKFMQTVSNDCELSRLLDGRAECHKATLNNALAQAGSFLGKVKHIA